LVRYILVAGLSDCIFAAVPLIALASAEPIFSADDVTIVLPKLLRLKSILF
jgi:hypothetical protein